MYDKVSEIRYTKKATIYFKFYIGTDIDMSPCDIIIKSQNKKVKYTTSVRKADIFLKKIDYIDNQYNQKDSFLNSIKEK